MGEPSAGYSLRNVDVTKLGTVKSGKKGLSGREEAFVEHYLATWNATKAATSAGYSAHTARSQGSRLLTRVDIASRIKERTNERLSELRMTSDEVLGRLTDAARVDMGDFLTLVEPEYPDWLQYVKYKPGCSDVVGSDGKLYKCHKDSTGANPVEDLSGMYWRVTQRKKFVDIDLEKALRTDRTHLIKKAGYNKFGQLEIELVDGQAAQVHLGRHHKLFTDKQEHTGRDGGAIEMKDLSAEARAKKVLELLSRAEGRSKRVDRRLD